MFWTGFFLYLCADFAVFWWKGRKEEKIKKAKRDAHRQRVKERKAKQAAKRKAREEAAIQAQLESKEEVAVA